MAGSTSRLSLSAASVPPACWRLSRIGIGARIEPSTPCGSRVPYTQSRYGSDPRASQSSGADRQGVIAMKKQRVVRGIPVEVGSGNVYADLGYPDSESMLVKARLAAKIAEIVEHRALTQTRTAEILGLTQPKVSALLKGRFRGI